MLIWRQRERSGRIGEPRREAVRIADRGRVVVARLGDGRTAAARQVAIAVIPVGGARSAYFTQRRKSPVAQSALPAIDSIAAHRELYSSRSAATNRTAPLPNKVERPQIPVDRVTSGRLAAGARSGAISASWSV